ncbi:hypothetical protein MFM001_39980 [Mycobacterium sp. MFM001]|nr:hypothetical protein MFM001_39980 [Mycobacterium sp. MFM001]
MLVLALLMALNPVRLGLILLVISRPRPVQNLLAFWVGCLIEGFPAMLVPLMVLHRTPMFKSFVDHFATSSTARHIQVGLGMVALSVAALVTIRPLIRRRQRAQIPTSSGNASTLVLDSNTPNAFSRLLSRAHNAPREGSGVRRLLDRAHNAWENGSLWVAFVIGLLSGPAPDEALYVLAIIVASGPAMATQVSASIAFVVAMLVIVELTLASYLVIPARTQAIVQRLHDWTLAHRRIILVGLCIIGGVSLIASGLGNG